MSFLKYDFKNLNCDSLTELVDEYMKNTNKTIQTIVSTNLDTATFENTFQLLIDDEHKYGSVKSLLSIVSDFYEDEKINSLAVELKKKITDFEIKVNFNYDLYDQLNKTFQKLDFTKLTLDEQKYVNDTMLNYKRSGIHLKDPTIEKMNKELANMAIEFSNNTNKYQREFKFTKSELPGVPERWFTKDKLVDEEKQVYKVTLSYPDYFSIIEYCHNEKTRKFMYEQFDMRCSDTNETLMTKIFQMRHELAKKLGYKNYADYATEKKLIKTGTNAINFLNNLNKTFDEQYQQEYNTLLSFAQLYKENPLNKNKLDKWDNSYYGRLLKERECNIDKDKLTDYFPLNHVVKATMEIYQKLLSLTFTEVETTNKWNTDIKLYEVKDTKTNEVMGHFFLDLYPRKNKYGHAAVFDIYPSYNDGNKQTLSLCAMACNFEKEGCISFDNTKTFFHEFGHVMHFTCSRTQLAHTNGFNIEWDAVEIPSTMFELWCLEQKSMDILSCHKDTKLPLDESTVNNLKKFTNFNCGMFIKRQLHFGMFDLTVHTYDFDNSAFSCQKIWNELDTSLMKTTIFRDAKGFCSFGHIISGYSAGYYGYLLSESHADQIFYKLFKNNVLDEVNGMKLRKVFFEQGSSKGADILFEELVGDSFDPKYFLEMKKT